MDHGPVGGSAAQAELLPTPYFHTVFTVPHALNALILGNKRPLLTLLFRSRQPDAPPVWPAEPGRPARRHAWSCTPGTRRSSPFPPPLSGARWRVGRGRDALGAHPSALPLPCAGLEHGLPRQVPRGLTTGLPQEALVLRSGGCPSARLPQASPACSTSSIARRGWSTPSRHAPGQPKSSTIWAALPTASRLPIIASVDVRDGRGPLHLSPSAPRQSGADHDAGGP